MKKQFSLDVVNKNAAGIDSRSHWVAVGQSDDLIKEFGVFNVNLRQWFLFVSCALLYIRISAF